MSKIAISGSPSGTATYTIQSPSGSTDRVLTLPDATGTIITTAGGAAISGTTGAFTTTVGVGGATPAASGAGITFPATASASSDANTLDDYEEGTFTPNLVNNGASSTFTQKDGFYRKIGSAIFYWVRFDGGNSGGGGGTLQVVNLPFTFLSGTAGAQTGGIWGANGLATNTGNINPQGGTNYANIYIGGGIVSSTTSYLSASIMGMTSA